jgi:hypothetical protein
LAFIASYLPSIPIVVPGDPFRVDLEGNRGETGVCRLINAIT